jgi:hypothetical protein
MVIVMLMLFKYLIYVIYTREDINLMQFLLLTFFLGSKFVYLPWAVLVYEYPLGTSETFVCFVLVFPIKIVPPAGVQLPQIQFIINCMSSEGKFSHLVRCDILLHYYKVSLLINNFYLFVCFGSVCLICVLFIVCCYLCLPVVLFL